MGGTAHDYDLDANLGFLLRRAQQLNAALFAQLNASGLSGSQFAALCRLVDEGATSQNALGRRVNADGATIKGIVNRLEQRGAVVTSRDDADRRQLIVQATDDGAELFRAAISASEATSERMLAGLTAGERILLIELLTKITADAPDEED
jgi:DNA-binding MarR family transcriptional regulator